MEKISHFVVGVDTHLDSHVAALLDTLGQLVANASFPATLSGYCELLEWARSYGEVGTFAIEGTGSYGAGLARYLDDQEMEAVEVVRANRRSRRHLGKSDPRDAEGAARALLSGEATASPKLRSGAVESIRVLRLARSTAVKARTQAAIQLGTVLVTASDDLRDELTGLRSRDRIKRCARLRIGDDLDPRSAAKHALRLLAKRHQRLDEEVSELDGQITRLVAMAAPRLLSETGIGTETAARLLVVAGENPDRLRSDGALAALCGASPVEASSGKVKRHRLNRGGDRQGNNVLYRIAMSRMMQRP